LNPILHRAASAIQSLTSDRVAFTLFEIAFWSVVLLAYVKEKQFWHRIKHRILGPPSIEIGMSVKRGDESWNYFLFAYGVASVVITQVISSTSAFRSHKTVFVVSNLGALLYLCFFNAWFRNKVLALILKARTLEEKR
jgi:hypothetical protein